MIPNRALERTPDNMTKVFNRVLVHPTGAVVPPKNRTKPVKTLIVKADMIDDASWKKQNNFVNIPFDSIYKNG